MLFYEHAHSICPEYLTQIRVAVVLLEGGGKEGVLFKSARGKKKKKFETNGKNLYFFNRACKIYSPGLISSEGSGGLMIGMAGNHAFRT